jgi:glycosyltransferase involved in cell wall biosynthesis
LDVWYIADSLLTDATDGHQFWEPKLLSEELRRRGKKVKLVGHTSIAASNFPAAETVPLFPLYFTEPHCPDPSWGYMENFVIQNRSFLEALLGLRPAPGARELVLFPNATERQLLGIFRWLDHIDPRQRPCVALILGAMRDWTPSNPAIRVYQKLWAECPPAIKESLRLCARTEMTARKFQDVLGTVPHVLPSALAPTAREIDATRGRTGNPKEPLTVSFIGGARHERGAMLVPGIVRQCLPFGVRFCIQITDALELSFGVSSLKALRGLPGVEVHEGLLARETYLDWIARSVVLLPYAREDYRWRSSGVYLEAKCFGSPVIVPEGTWMAEDVKRCGNGVVFAEYSPAAIAKAIALAQAGLADLRARAEACAPEVLAAQGADRFVDKVESLFPAPNPRA